MERAELVVDAAVEGGYVERARAVREQKGIDEGAVLVVLAGISSRGKGEETERTT